VPVGEPQHAVVAEVAHVAGVEPAVRERRGGGLLVVQVAGHGARPPVDDLAGLAGRQQVAVRAHDRDLNADQRGADGADVGKLVLGPEQRGARAHLGLPEQQREVAAEPGQAPADEVIGHRRHGVHRPAQAEQVAIGEARVVEHGPVHHGQAEDLGDLLPLDQVEQDRRIKSAHDVDRGADHDRRGAERVELRGVEHRHHRGEPVVKTPAGVQRAGHRLQVDRLVRADHALGEGRGARGVQVTQRVPVLDETLRLCGVVVRS
jgi:hypothetical protein